MMMEVRKTVGVFGKIDIYKNSLYSINSFLNVDYKPETLFVGKLFCLMN